MESLNNIIQSFKAGKTDVGFNTLPGFPNSERNSDRLIYVATENAVVIRRVDGHAGKTFEGILLARVGGLIIGNSSVIRLNDFGGRGELKEQAFIAKQFPMIPFEVLKQAGLSLNGYKQLDRTPDETVFRKSGARNLSENDLKGYQLEEQNGTLKDLEATPNESVYYPGMKHYHVEYKRPEHFTGARLFEIDGRRFLMDLDRRELEHGLINPFLVELADKTVTTVTDAYQSLKPQDVKDAEARGEVVERQGEWFFIPCDAERTGMLCDLERAENETSHVARGETRIKNGVLQAGRNRPNRVSLMVEEDGKYFVKGIVSHSGREHEDLQLMGWFQAIPNTSISSWTITGDVD